jgi:hypothetical protein
MRALKISLLAGILVMAACSPRDFLTRRLAADLIAGSDTFKNPQLFWLRTGITSNKDYYSPESLLLQKRGWITAASVPCPPSVSPAPCWDVALTPHGVDTFRDLIPNAAAPSQYFSVPVAKRQFVGVTGISKNGNLADVDFLWKWIPLNEVGSALYPGDVQYKATVSCRRYDDGWRVIEGNLPRNDESLDEALKNSQPAQ